MGDVEKMQQKMTIENLISRAYTTAKEKGWWEDLAFIDNDRDRLNFILARVMLMVTELAEATEELRRDGLTLLNQIYYQEDGKVEGFTAELADVFIRIADMAGEFDLPLEQALREKMDYNDKRKYRHGGKKI